MQRIAITAMRGFGFEKHRFIGIENIKVDKRIIPYRIERYSKFAMSYVYVFEKSANLAMHVDTCYTGVRIPIYIYIFERNTKRKVIVKFSLASA